MKYFTLSWWNGIQELDNEFDPLTAYEEYFQTVKDDLPASFRKLHDEIYLHDGNLTKLKYAGVSGDLDISINNDDGKGNLREIYLSYKEVSLFESSANQDMGLPGPLGYGDLGYDEVEVFENSIEHRMLFSSGIEFKIQFFDRFFFFFHAHTSKISYHF